MTTRWIFDPDQIDAPPAAISGLTGEEDADFYMTSLAPAVVLAQNNCNGRCPDNHPGEYQSWWGQRNGCWIPFWRKWPDGCTNYQWYNSCYGSWDTRINWTCCVH